VQQQQLAYECMYINHMRLPLAHYKQITVAHTTSLWNVKDMNAEQTHGFFSTYHGEVSFGHQHNSECFSEEIRQNTWANPLHYHLKQLVCSNKFTHDAELQLREPLTNTHSTARCFWIWQETMKHVMGKQPWVKTHKCCPEHRCLVRHVQLDSLQKYK